MRVIAALRLAAAFLPILASGQTASKTSTFASADGAFRFVYPRDFQVCTRGKIDACNQTYIPVCKPDASARVGAVWGSLLNQVSFSSKAIEICCKRGRNADFTMPLSCWYRKRKGWSVLMSSACSQPLL